VWTPAVDEEKMSKRSNREHEEGKKEVRHRGRDQRQSTPMGLQEKVPREKNARKGNAAKVRGG